MIRLGVNVDHIATVRQARLTNYPSPTQASVLAELGGADNITCHLREDRRHIQDHDVRLLKEVIQIPLNFEIATTKEMIAIACQHRPQYVTLVPEKRKELTTESGLNVLTVDKSYMRSAIMQLHEYGCIVSLFVDPNQKALELSKELGVQAVEIHTGDFADQFSRARTTKEQFQLLQPLQTVTNYAYSLGLQVHIGHGINYQNARWIQQLPHVEEANIGHAIMARAIFVGLQAAVQEMKELLNNPIYNTTETVN